MAYFSPEWDRKSLCPELVSIFFFTLDGALARIPRVIWLWASFVIFLISLAVSLIGAPKEIFWSSEALYLPSILIDIVREGGSLRGWSFAPTPYFFPDLPLVFLFGSVTGNAFGAILTYAIFQSLVFGGLLGRFIHSIEPKMRRSGSYSLGLLSASFLFLLAEKFPTLYYLYLPSSHTSAFLITLWIWPYLRKERVRKYLVFPILILSVFSDRILLFTLFLPAGLAWARRYGRWGVSFPLISVRFFASGALGFGLYSLSRVVLTIQSPNKIATGESFTLWWSDWIDSILNLELQGIFLILALVTAFWSLAKSREWGHSLAFAGYFQIILIFLPPLAGLYSGPTGIKLSLPAFTLVPVLFGVLVSLPRPEFGTNARNIALLGAILGLAFFSIFHRNPDTLWGLQGFPKPNEASCIDDLKETDSFVFVISEPQKARRIFAYSDKRALAYPVDFSTLEGLHAISNREWFLFPPEGPIGVIPEGLGEHRIRSFYGEPSRILTCPKGKDSLWIYENTDKIREFLQRPFQKTK
ncbi:hypothetical protein [Leptospira wolffii]|uniref:hypothetical protein n=1 Tax=Leptospira wolffii TaxID=409998 RepID=UPI001A9C7F6E|nr:hypothetical protein [Leptospira wolffii]